MQNDPEAAQPERAFFYWARMYDSDLKRGFTYAATRPCVLIWILGHERLRGARFHNIFQVLDREGREVFTDVLELHTVVLPRLPRRGAEGADTALAAWARFLPAQTEPELEELAMTNAELEKAWEEVKRLNQDPETRAWARKREEWLISEQMKYGAARAESRAEGKAEGKAEGRAEGKAEGVLRVLDARSLALADEQRARILACRDLEQLDRWLVRAVTATSATDVFEP